MSKSLPFYVFPIYYLIGYFGIWAAQLFLVRPEGQSLWVVVSIILVSLIIVAYKLDHTIQVESVSFRLLLALVAGLTTYAVIQYWALGLLMSFGAILIIFQLSQGLAFLIKR